MNEVENKPSYLLKGAVYGLVAAIILWLILSTIVALTFGSLERVVLIASVGILFWGIAWSIAGAVIGFLGMKSLRWKLVGAICGIIIGEFSVVLFIIWPRCDYNNVIDKVFWAIPMAIEMPTRCLSELIDMFFEKVFHVCLYQQGSIFIYTLWAVSSVILWANFGMMLGNLIARESKTKLR